MVDCPLLDAGPCAAETPSARFDVLRFQYDVTFGSGSKIKVNYTAIDANTGQTLGGPKTEEVQGDGTKADRTLPLDGLVPNKTYTARLRVSPSRGEAAEIPIKVLVTTPTDRVSNLRFVSPSSGGPDLQGTVEARYEYRGTADKHQARMVVYELAPQRDRVVCTDWQDIEAPQPCQDLNSPCFVLSWDSTQTYGGASAKVLCTLEVRQTEEGAEEVRTEAGSCERAINNSSPRVEIGAISSIPITVTSTRTDLCGSVVILYRVKDAGSESCDVMVEVELSSGFKLSSAKTGAADDRLSEALGGLSEGTRGLETSPDGKPHFFVWNSDGDIDRLLRNGKAGLSSPRAGRVTITVTVTDPGTGAQARHNKSDFSVDNRLLHTVGGIVPGQTAPGERTSPKAEATFTQITSAAADPTRTVLYLTDAGMCTLWRMDFDDEADGVERVAGGRGVRPASDDPCHEVTASSFALNGPVDVAVGEDQDEVYLLEGQGFLYKVSPTKDSVIPLLTSKVLRRPQAIAYEASAGSKYLYVADSGNCRVLRYDVTTNPAQCDEVFRVKKVLGDLEEIFPTDNPVIGADDPATDGPEYPDFRHGCNFVNFLGGPPTAIEEDCKPGFAKAPGGVALLKTRLGQRLLLVSETLQFLEDFEDDGVTKLRGKVRAADLGKEGEDLVGPGLSFLEVFQASNNVCPPENLLSRPKTLRVEERGGRKTLFVASDGVKLGVSRSRGIVLEADLDGVESPADLKGRPLEYVAGITQPGPGGSPAMRCVCGDSTTTNYDKALECKEVGLVRLGNPTAVVLDRQDRVYICDQFNQRVWRLGDGRATCVLAIECPVPTREELSDAGRLSTFVGGGVEGRSLPESRTDVRVLPGVGIPEICSSRELVEGESAVESRYDEPVGIGFLDETTLVVGDGNQRARLLDLRTAVVTTIAGRVRTCEEIEKIIGFRGDKTIPGDDPDALDAILRRISAVASLPPWRPTAGEASRFWCEPDRRILVVDNGNHVVRAIHGDGTISTLVGSGLADRGDGFADTFNRPVAADVPNVGLASECAAPKRVFLNFPTGLCVDSRGAVLVSDCRNRIVRVNSQGTELCRVIGRGRDMPSVSETAPFGLSYQCNVSLASGQPKENAPSADIDVATGVASTEAWLLNPAEMVFDEDEEFLYFADSGYNRIRRARYDRAAGKFTGVETVVGTGGREEILQPGDPEQDGKTVQIIVPYGVDMDLQRGFLYFTTESRGKVWRLNVNTGKVRVLAGVEAPGAVGDGGEARFGRFSSPKSIRVDAVGNLYIVDSRNHRIRKFYPN
ncbi:MAG: hypothetical protein HY721_34595 [Planctomycetes bacterium]|nr:hypothetical protein [Planctomycetota bacterium]